MSLLIISTFLSSFSPVYLHAVGQVNNMADDLSYGVKEQELDNLLKNSFVSHEERLYTYR